ncbi:MAG TPA: glycosyltransferase, partial [Phycisphaerae bacterium]|nr:glycosyltransferase [Phycisphaerae bacterium]
PVPRPRRLRVSRPWDNIPTRLETPPGALRVLVLSHMFPHPDQPSSGTFVHEQVKALRVEGGVDARVLVGRPFWMTTRHPLRLWQGNASWRRHHDEARWYLYDGIPVQYLPYRIFGPWFTHGWSYARTMIRSIEQLHREFPFDIIHAHTGYLDGSAGREISRRLNKPLILTEHTGPFSMLMKNPIIRRRTLRSLSAASRVIAVSHAQEAAIAQYWAPNRRDQMVVVPNLVDTLQFHPPQEWRPDPAAPRILFVGGFVPIKALPVLLDALVKVRERLPAANLTLVGGGENQAQEDTLHADIAARGLSEAARVLGHQGRREIARLMREECDILVLCSHSETFGCVLIEALASGKPVVATRCGGPQDIVTDDSLGRLCPTNDPQALADAIMDVASRLPAFDSARIRDYAVSRFSQSATATTIVNHYQTVLGERSMARP